MLYGPHVGRIGSGELVSLLFGAVGPLLGIVLQLAVVLWNRRLMRAGLGRVPRVGMYSGVLSMVLPMLGVLVTVLMLGGSFADVGRVGPEARAHVLAEGIASAMVFTVAGLVAGTVAIVVSLGCAIYAQWGPRPGQPQLPTGPSGAA